MKNTNQLVVGIGEVGSAISFILKSDKHDPFKGIQAPKKQYDVLHICIPFNAKFIESVKKYQKEFKPKFIVIHSTVPIGTSRKLGATHSPVRGVHPHMVKGIKTFVKFFGGKNAKEAAQIFEKCGVKTQITPNSETTEALKLWDTTQYGIMITVQKEIHDYCKKNKINFDIVYTLGNSTYNEGYRKLGRPEVARPFLKHMDGPIGGHCVIPNAHLIDSPSARELIKKNKGYTKKKTA